MQNHQLHNYSGIEELWTIENQLIKYNQDIALKISNEFKERDQVLEFGAGIGTIASLILKNRNVRPDCVELDPSLQGVLKKRGFEVYSSIQKTDKHYNHVYLSNVLEHIEDDVEILKDIYQKICTNGRVIIYSPAFQILYTDFDAQVGHYRRYELSELKDKLARANFSVVHFEYVDSLGFMAWSLLKFNKLFKRRTSNQNKSNSHASFAIYDKFFYPISRTLDAMGLKRFFGKNIFIIGKKN